MTRRYALDDRTVVLDGAIDQLLALRIENAYLNRVLVVIKSHESC